MKKSAIILAGGFSSRLGQDKGLLCLSGKPLISYVLSAASRVTDETIIVVSSQEQVTSYSRLLGSRPRLLVDKDDVRSPLVGALTGLEEADGEYFVLLPCDTPMVSVEVLSLFFELCVGKNAVIPRWPNCCLEPLQAVYQTESALEAAREAFDAGVLRMQGMIDRLCGVRYVSTLVIQQIDPELRTFFNVNTLTDLKKAESILKNGRKRGSG